MKKGGKTSDDDYEDEYNDFENEEDEMNESIVDED